MPMSNSKSRQELRSRFVRNAIPTETDFADLIAASLNQADDGVLKLPDQPLGLVRQKPDQPVLRFFADPAAEGSVWQVQLGAGDKPGFGLAGADGKLALFVDGGTGNVGIGTTTPGFKLDVNGSVRLGCFTTEEKAEWPNLVWCRDLDKGWDEGLIKHGKDKGFFDRAGFGVHIHKSRSFELFSSDWQALLGVEGGSGNTSIRGQTTILTGSNPIRFSSSWTGFPDDKTNGAEICNDTDFHKTLMIIGNKSASGTGGGRRVSVWDILEVNGTFRVQSPIGLGADGKFALFVDGATDNVRIGATASAAVSVTGNLQLKECLLIPKGKEIWFSDNGQIRSLDNNHRILFRRDESKMELREYGDIVFSSGSTQGQETSKMVIHRSGNVGIGTTMPAAKLQITGNVCITSADGESYSCRHNFMAPGSLTIGGNDRNYGGGTNWNDNTAGLLLETLDNTEIAIHDSNLRLASFMYYESANNCFTIGRDMGWGPIATVNVQGGLKVNGRVDSSNARFQATANDPISIKIAPIKIAPIKIAPIKIAPDKIAPDKIAPDKIAPDDWTDMSKMIVTASIDGPVLVLFKTGGVQGAPGKNVRARFRLLIDNIEKAFTLHEFHNEGWELRDASLMWLESLTPGNHEFKVQWRAEGGEVCACLYNDLRSLIVIKL